jgi:hypothetical protein
VSRCSVTRLAYRTAPLTTKFASRSPKSPVADMAPGRKHGESCDTTIRPPPGQRFDSLARIPVGSASKISVSPAALVGFLPCAIDNGPPTHTTPRPAQLKAVLDQAQSVETPARTIASVESRKDVVLEPRRATGGLREVGRRVACSRTGCGRSSCRRMPRQRVAALPARAPPDGD